MPLDRHKVAVAVKNIESLTDGTGTLAEIPGTDPSKVLAYFGPGEGENCIWAVATYAGYRSAWDKAHKIGYVDSLSEWGLDIDVDHLFPRSWAKHNRIETWWIRMHPVFAEVNRSAGGGRERAVKSIEIPKDGIIYAVDMQLDKILSHPVGTVDNPETSYI